MRNLASGIAFTALNIAFVTSAQSPAVSAGTSVKPGPEKGGAYRKDRVRPDTCFRLGLACEHYPESRKAPADDERLLAVIDRNEQAVRDVEEEAHRVGARCASPRRRVRTGLH
jgi:hypothetical protein